MQRFVYYIAIFFIYLLPINALSNDIFSIDTISVDRLADNATIARGQALANAQERALDKILKRITHSSHHNSLPEVSSDDMALLVKSYKIRNERISKGRYRADIQVSFVPEYIRNLLKDSGIKYTEKVKPKTLLIPVMHKNGKVHIWGRENVWKDAIAKTAADSGMLTEFIMPLGDIEDMALINHQKLQSNNPEDFKAISERYNAPDVTILNAYYVENSSNNEVILRIVTNNIGSINSSNIANFSSLISESDKDYFLVSAASDIIKRLENEWKSDIANNNKSLDITVISYYDNIKEWVEIRKLLSHAMFLKDVNINSISSEEAHINLSYDGNLDSLLVKLNEHNLYIIEEDSSLILKSSL